MNQAKGGLAGSLFLGKTRDIGCSGDGGIWSRCAGLAEVVEPTSSLLEICFLMIRYVPIISPYFLFYRDSKMAFALNPRPERMSRMLESELVSLGMFSSYFMSHGCC